MSKLSIYYFDVNGISVDELIKHSFLNENDIKELDKYTSSEAKKEKIISTHFKNKYVGEYYLNEYGKPLSNNTYFNISHSKGMIVCLISDYEVGIDIEKIRPYKKELKSYISNEDEEKYIKTDANFYEIWTSKESLVKANGKGLRTNIKSIPALPINGRVSYEEKVYNRKSVRLDNYIISVTIESDVDYKIDLIKEELDYAW